MQTELWEKLGKDADDQKKMVEEMAEKLPVKFVAEPEHIAEAYLYAVRADYATGSLIEIGEWFFSSFFLVCRVRWKLRMRCADECGKDGGLTL